jgi:hypothetical protein
MPKTKHPKRIPQPSKVPRPNVSSPQTIPQSPQLPRKFIPPWKSPSRSASPTTTMIDSEVVEPDDGSSTAPVV